MKIQHINFLKLQEKKKKTGSALLTRVSLLSSHLWQRERQGSQPTQTQGPASQQPLLSLKKLEGVWVSPPKRWISSQDSAKAWTRGSGHTFSNSVVFRRSFFSDTLFCRKFVKAVVKRLERKRDTGKSLKTDRPYSGPQEWPVPALVRTHTHTCPPQVQCSLSPTRGHKKWTLSYAITLPSGRVDLNLRTGYFSGPHCLKLDWPPLGHQWFCCSPKAWPSKAPRSESGWSIWTASLTRIPRASPVTSSQ